MRNPIMSLTRSFAQRTPNLQLITIKHMAPKKTTPKAGKAGKAKSTRKVSSETKSRNASSASTNPAPAAASTTTPTPPLYGVARPSEKLRGTSAYAFEMKEYHQKEARDLRARADELEEWWKNDTKKAARFNTEGKKLVDKEGGPSTIDDLFEKTCLEMEAEEAEAEEPEEIGSESQA
ncbi:hypothetical protein FOXB_02513 [Fusarium oxysporum f. sp. conglutinans Fo5176]|uniref:Uncharacterized protein n=1 Tax=Fusarium oxysporum (strain Fo5176) TaxID=660025 RepID=F9F7Y8_FUSOF|nr:hypothetical protein FOXB_02513 [Fusarium oxysporum f. sp. conglutinans Fo5176]